MDTPYSASHSHTHESSFLDMNSIPINPSGTIINTIPLSQNQNNTISSTSTNSRPNTSSVTEDTTTSPSTNLATHELLQPKKNLVRLYHDDKVNYIIEDYCQPVNESFISPQDDVCKYNRECVVAKCKVLTKGKILQTAVCSTVFRYVPTTSVKHKYTTYDVRLIKCFNPSCKHQKSKSPKIFHHVCFMHMLKMSTKDDEMKLLKVEGPEDNILKLIDKKVDLPYIKKLDTDDLSNLIFPFCGKRCFKTINTFRNKINYKGDSEYASAQSWDKDGSSKHRTSMEVLIDWFTTEENCSSYFGGVDSNGRTNANRKETYHYYLRDLIRQENGKFQDIYMVAHYIETSTLNI